MIHIGYYGKLPHRGDFVRFNLPQTFLNVWDDWLQQLLIRGEQIHGNDWSTIYSSSDSYRFVLDEQLAGISGWVGLMLPGTDKVGRRFPFCLAAKLSDGLPATVAISQLEPWFSTLEKIAVTALESDEAYSNLQSTLEEFAQAGFGLAPQAAHMGATYESADNEQVSVGFQMADSRALASANNAHTMLHTLLAQTVGQYSVWCSIDSMSKNPSTVITQGLPSGAAGIALFDRAWSTANLTVLSPTANPVIASAQAVTEVGAAVMAAPDELSQWQQTPETQTVQHTTDANLTATENQFVENNIVDLEHDIQSSTQQTTDSEYETESLSTGDWSALDLEDNDPIVPVIEELELDDDSPEDEPWVT